MSSQVTGCAILPPHLYKYCSLGSPEQRRRSRGRLVDRIVYYASPGSFNDPFDCRAYLVADPNVAEMREAHRQMTTRYSEAEAEELLVQVLDPDRHDEFERQVQCVQDEYHRRFGVFCTSEVDDSIPMWAHYAGNHTGVCIQYDTKYLRNAVAKRIGQVVYSPHLPARSFFGRPLDDRLLLTKADSWSYEREWRWFGEPGQERRLPPRAISGVVLGFRMSDEDRREVRSWLAGRRPTVRVLTAVPRTKDYGLDIVPPD